MKSFWQEINDSRFFEYIDKLGLFPRFIIAVLFIIIAWALGFFINKIFKVRFKKRFDDPMLPIFLANILRIIIVLIGFVLALQILNMGDIAKSLLAGAGITAFVIGFALKDIGENFLSGILLASKKPFRVGDLIECNGVKGVVTALNLRDTEVKTADGKDVFIPNSMLVKNPLLNYTIDGSQRFEFIVKTNYDENITHVKQILESILNEVQEGESAMFNSMVQITDVSTDGFLFTLYFWLQTKSNTSSKSIQSKVLIRVVEEFSKHEIKIERNKGSVKN